MKTREKFSAALLGLGIMLALLPSTGARSLTVKPEKLLAETIDAGPAFTPDQVARFVVSEDSTVRLIDLRSAGEFKSFNIPGSINVPYEDFLVKDPHSFIAADVRNIFYSNGDLDANYALVLARGMRFENVFVMRGGLNEWFNTVMNSSFSGDRITARENALFETRTRARKMFTEVNSLPDSLKSKLLESKRIAAKKLDGGCE